MRKISRLVWMTLLLGIFTAAPAWAREEAQIRVLLASGVSSIAVTVEEGDYQLIDSITLLPVSRLEEGDQLTVNQAGSNLEVLVNGEDGLAVLASTVLLQPEDDDELNVFSYRGTQYRGTAAVSLDGSRLLLVNQLGIESYLYGVVGREMGASAPEEALKAQAVVSRSYALSFCGRSLKYDVSATTGSQVYGGYSAESAFGAAKVIEAVDDTRHEVIYYWGGGDKTLVQACFHANSGGYTEDSANVWYSDIPYLRGVRSEEDSYALEYSRKTGEPWAADSYRWTKTMDQADVTAAITAYNKKVSNPISIGDFQELVLYSLARDGKSSTVSGRITKVELIGSKGKGTVSGENIRTLFGLKSTLFSVETSGAGKIFVMGASGQSQRFTPDRESKVIGAAEFLVDLVQGDSRVVGAGRSGQLGGGIESLTFKGYGYGHGVGMSQWGARGMAVNGADYREIINRYYNRDRDNDDLTVEDYN